MGVELLAARCYLYMQGAHSTAIPAKALRFGEYDMDVISKRLSALESLDELYFIELNPHLFDPKELVADWLRERYVCVESFQSRYRIGGGKYVRGPDTR